MSSIQCSSAAYTLLDKTGIAERTARRAEDLKKINLHRTIERGEAGRIVDHVRAVVKGLETPRYSPDFYTDITALEEELRDDDLALNLSRENLPRHPYLLAGLVFGEEVRNFQKFGFASEKIFAEAITAYCLGETRTIQGDHTSYSWRTGERKHSIELISHGDVSVGQYLVGGESPLLSELWATGFTVVQDSAPFLILALHYAHFLGLSQIPEITEWEPLVAEFSQHHPYGGGYSAWKKASASERESEAEGIAPPLVNSRFIGNVGTDHWPLRIERQGGALWPILRGRELDIYSASERGSETIYPWGNGSKSGHAIKAEKIVTYTPQDVPHLLTGIYKTYARDRSEMCLLLELFNNGAVR